MLWAVFFSLATASAANPWADSEPDVIAELTVPERSRRAADLLREQAEVDEVAPFGAILRVAVLGGHDPVALCRRVLAQEDIAVASAEEARPTVEDAFVSMVRSENAQ